MLTFLIQCTGHLPVWACLVSICFPRSIQGLLLRQLYFERRSDSWLSDAELVCSQQLASNNRTQELQQKSRGVNQRSSPHPSRSWTQILMGHQTRLSELRTRQPPPLPKIPAWVVVAFPAYGPRRAIPAPTQTLGTLDHLLTVLMRRVLPTGSMHLLA